MDKALSGIRIIDMTHNQAGPACTQILGFLGADVIKLEEPKGGDIARVNMRDQNNSDSLFFLILNANKRSLTLNLKTARMFTRAMSPPLGSSSLITSAPRKPRICVQAGPAWLCVMSMMRMPDKALSMVALRMDGMG
jgi:hypothetical protein